MSDVIDQTGDQIKPRSHEADGDKRQPDREERGAESDRTGCAYDCRPEAAGQCAGEMEALQGTIIGEYLKYWPEVAGTAELVIWV